MRVYYRMTDIKSTNPSPIYQEDKYTLNSLCLKSFVDAYKGVNPKVTFLCDYCPENYTALIETCCPFDHEIEYTKLGINGTAVRQFELAQQEDDPILLFQECDYVYRPNIGMDMVAGILDFGLVSPYDHKNFYLDRSIHSDMVQMKLIGDTHWRSTERNTMTFGMQGELFKEYAYLFVKYGYLDDQIWYDLDMYGVKMFVPIPSFATHCVVDYLAPGIKWSDVWTKYL